MISTYTLNGIDLDDNTFGWTLQDESAPFPGIGKRAQDLRAGDQDGNVPLSASEDSPIIALVVRVADDQQEPFLALLDSASLQLGHDSRVATVELLSARPTRFFGGADYLCLFRVNGMFWRDASVSTSTATVLTTSPQTVSVMSDLSAPVRDAIIRVKGGLTDLTVTDSRGSFFHYGAALTGTEYFRFESATGRAYVTSSDVWTGGTEVTGLVGNGPGPYFLQLSPKFTVPGTRAVELTVATAGRSSSPAIEVRGARAYRV